MSYHPISFENLADYIDGRLGDVERRAVEHHISTGCAQCEADLAWLRRMRAAAQFHSWQEPPAEAVAAAKGLYGPWLWQQRRSAEPERRRSWNWVPRLAFAFITVLLVAVATAYALAQIPGLIPRHARLTARTGVVEWRRLADDAWQTVPDQGLLAEGSQVRVPAGEAMLTLFDGSALLMKSDSELRLDTLRSGLTGLARQIAIQQFRGEVEYDVAELRHARSSFRAETPSASIAVRGTRFVVTVAAEASTQLALFEGSVHVEVVGGSLQVSSPVSEAVLTHDESAVIGATGPIVLLPTLTPPPTSRQPTAVPVTSAPAPSATSKPAASATAAPSATQAVESRPSRTATHTEVPSVPTATVVAGSTAPTSISPTSASPAPAASQTAPPTFADTAAAPTPTVSATPVPLTPTTPPPGVQEPALTTFGGKITSFPRAHIGQWVIGDQNVWVTHFTQISGTPRVGLSANVVARRLSDRVWIAQKINVLASGGEKTLAPTRTHTPSATLEPTASTPTNTVLPTATLTAVPSWTPEPSVTAAPTFTETAQPGGTEQPTATATNESIRTPGPGITPQPRASRTPAPTRMPKDTPTALATNTQRQSPTPEPTDSSVATPTPVTAETRTPVFEPSPTRQPLPTRTEPILSTMTAVGTSTPPPTLSPAPPTPSPTPGSPSVERWSGKISQIPPGRLGPWMIGGRIVQVTSSTSIQGKPAVGLRAEVEAVSGGAFLRAIRIEVINSP